MKRNFSSRKSAFSLVELAIVLIIIGLLIAGITGGAALIKSAELRSVVTEARANSVSVSAFYSLYDSLPGDSKVVLTSGGNQGNGDGKMEFCRGGTCTDLNNSEGGGGAWKHMSDAGVVNLVGITQVASNASQTPGVNFPASKLKPGGWMFDYDATNLVNVAVLVQASNLPATTLTGITTYQLLLASDMYSIDTKNDDGNPDKGKIRALGGATCKASAAYVLTTTNPPKACTVTYDIDVGQG